MDHSQPEKLPIYDAVPGRTNRIENVIVEKQLKEDIIDLGQAIHGPKTSLFKVLIASDHMHTAHLICNTSMSMTWSKWDILASGRPAADVLEALQQLLDGLRREFAVVVASKGRR